MSFAGHDVELERMQAAEKEQCKSDKFWGLDLQFANCSRECMYMSFEDELSRTQERIYRTSEKQSKWKDEFSRLQYQTAYDFALKEQENRKRYMSLLFTAPSSDVLMHYRWNVFEGSMQLHSLIDPPNMSNSNVLMESQSSSQILTLPPPDLGPRTVSLHLDGIQQSKSLSKGESSLSLGPSLRNRNIQSVVEDSLTINKSLASMQRVNTSNTRSKVPAAQKTGILKSTAPEIATLSTEDLLKAMEPTHKIHNPKVDGHPQFKWDQEIILKTVFRKLDSRRRGFVTLEDVGQIAQNVPIQELLAFTVFGAWVKKRSWKKFVALCDSVDVTSTLTPGHGISASSSNPLLLSTSNGGGGGGYNSNSRPGSQGGGVGSGPRSGGPTGSFVGREFSNRERTISAQQVRQ